MYLLLSSFSSHPKPRLILLALPFSFSFISPAALDSALSTDDIRRSTPKSIRYRCKQEDQQVPHHPINTQVSYHTSAKFSNAMHSTPYYTSNPLQTKSNSHEHPCRCVLNPFHPILQKKEERRKEENRLLLILGLVLVDLEVSEGVGVFGGSDDSVY
jgi:hypothetical protein